MTKRMKKQLNNECNKAKAELAEVSAQLGQMDEMNEQYPSMQRRARVANGLAGALMEAMRQFGEAQ